MKKALSSGDVTRPTVSRSYSDLVECYIVSFASHHDMFGPVSIVLIKLQLTSSFRPVPRTRSSPLGIL